MNTVNSIPRRIPLSAFYSGEVRKATVIDDFAHLFTANGPQDGIDLCNYYERRPRNVFKQTLRDLSKGRGLSYEQAIQLTAIRRANKDFTLRGIKGFWDNKTTAGNMTYCAMDSINKWKEKEIELEDDEFKKTRELYLYLRNKKGKEELTPEESFALNVLTAKLSDILRSEVLKNGGGEVFLKQSKLRGLVVNHRDFLDKQSSLGSILRAFLPGIIDEENEFALQPHEVEDDWWNNQDYAKRQVFRQLSKLNGMKELLKEYKKLKDENPINKKAFDITIQKIADILRSEVLENGGGEVFLRKSKLYGLVVNHRDFLDTKGNLGSVLRAFLPEVAEALRLRLIGRRTSL